MEKMCYEMVGEIGELSAILTKEAGQCCTCSIDQQLYNHTDMARKGGIRPTCCHCDLQSVE